MAASPTILLIAGQTGHRLRIQTLIRLLEPHGFVARACAEPRLEGSEAVGRLATDRFGGGFGWRSWGVERLIRDTGQPPREKRGYSHY